MPRTVFRSSSNCRAISDFDRRSMWNNRCTCRQQSSRTMRPSPSGVTSGPVSPSAGASPDNNVSLMNTPSSVRRDGENSMTTRGDYWMIADTGLARDVLHERHGAFPDERDRERVGADAVASGAGGGVGGVGAVT